MYLTQAKNGSKLRYAGLVGCRDYKKAAQLIKDGGYATDTKYVRKICSLIERWNLTKYDVEEEKTLNIINAISSKNVPQWGNKKQFIAIHYLGVVGQNNKVESGGYGAHYYIYWDGTVYQAADHDEVLWQVGTGGYYTQKHPAAQNSNTIGIELCCKCDGNSKNATDPYWYFTEETQEACVQLVKKLMKDLGIPVENVLRHYDIVNKHCPAPYVNNNKYKTSWTWNEFKAKLSGSSTATTDIKKELVKAGQTHANNFCKAGIKADGVRGLATKKAGIKVLQTALNLEHKAGLTIDGIWGSKSDAALKGHTVRKGNKGYMVTALEILLMLKGYNPNGVECPGSFGDGCAAATGQYQKDYKLTIDELAGYNTFKSLIV